MSYLDTSIIVPAYCTEPLSDRVGELLGKIANVTISDLTEAELGRMIAQQMQGSTEILIAGAVQLKGADGDATNGR